MHLLKNNIVLHCLIQLTTSCCAYRVSVQTGGSTTIPCHYVQKYKTHVKYLCKGDHLYSCSPVVPADPPKTKASVFDDINQLTMTVTMTDLEPEDSGRYFCAVEVNGGINVRAEWFHLSVIPGKIPATLPHDYMTGVLVTFTGITMRNVGVCLLSVL
uniref:Immunoglobulin domain-containing protein n=1 Tax=Oncorhynchus tshawytscha TaxID=74940 RepID=A0AAZ3NVM3_ONCTS